MARRDRYGEPIADDDLSGHGCHAGWLSDDPDTGLPRACHTCKPWLTGPKPRPPRPEELDEYRRKAL